MRGNGGKMRVTVDERCVSERCAGGAQNIHRCNVSGRARAQANRFPAHRLSHVHHLGQQRAVTIQLRDPGGCIHAELMQPEFKLIERKDGSPGLDRRVLKQGLNPLRAIFREVVRQQRRGVQQVGHRRWSAWSS